MLPPAVQNHPSWENLVVLCNGAQIRKLATGEPVRIVASDGTGMLVVEPLSK